MDNPFIYLRGLRHAEHTVFGVNDGQKYYFDPQFGRRMAYSSGQQVKRSVIEALNMPFAAITFNWEIDKKENKANQKEPHSPCDPSFTDQLLGGYSVAAPYLFRPCDRFILYWAVSSRRLKILPSTGLHIRNTIQSKSIGWKIKKEAVN